MSAIRHVRAHAGGDAAPTAGLHFTPALVAALQRRDVRCVPLIAHRRTSHLPSVRTASWRRRGSTRATRDPRNDGRRDHRCPRRRRACRRGRHDDGRGSRRSQRATAQSRPGRTDLVIGPGHRFRAIDALLTNFHLPRSSLLALVAAFAGVETTLTAYRAATTSRYRFYSYGDAMLVV